MESVQCAAGPSAEITDRVVANVVHWNHYRSKHKPALFPSPPGHHIGQTPRRKIQDPGRLLRFVRILTLTIWITLYDRVIVPRLSKYTRNPRGIGLKTRIGIGLFISCFATSTAALVERARRARAFQQGLAEDPKGQVNMSAMWLIPQHSLAGLVEAFNAIGQIELYYSQFPKSMASIAVALFALGMAIANLLGSLIVTIVDFVSKKGGGESWVSSNLNKGHYDYYYWILTILSVANLVYFNFVSRVYNGYEEEKAWDEDVVEENRTGAFITRETAMVDMPKSKDSSSSTNFFRIIFFFKNYFSYFEL
ncbi:hypothetical protein DH2020_029216 [Rehmannia glutinosa]|uniref:Uncharacterized protein n=1 Tax=Rehmannia glutinosa TaxID=99300 RepID=A0ABR0VQZ4_REHGL